MILYGIKNCDTVRKARRWLDERGQQYDFHDLRADGLDRGTIESWLRYVDWVSLLNKRGTTWRRLEDERKSDLDEDRGIDLMLAHPALIKRPVLVTDTRCLVGFSEADYAALIGGSDV